MEILNMPIVDFYNCCLDCAYKRGFQWVLCLLAREADAESSYEQIQRYWNSLYDLTGSQILFVFAGAINEKNERDSALLYEHESFLGVRNSALHIVSQPAPTIPHDYYSKIDFNKCNFDKIKSNHTRSISDLRDYLGLSERNIPSLVFTPTYKLVRDKHIVIPINEGSIYHDIKKIMEELEVPLIKLREQQYNYEHFQMQLSELSNQINVLNHRNKLQNRYIKAKKFLNEKINTIDSDIVRDSLITSMRDMSFINWNMYDHQTKAYLNQYIDLLKKYPCIDHESEKADLELEKCQKKKDELTSASMELSNQITASHGYIKETIEGLSKKYSLKSGLIKESREGERRFKVSFSFPGGIRDIVDKIATGVANVFSKEFVLYDLFHTSEFARPNLDTYLQDLYINKSELIVVFICSDYDRRKWCGIEWRAIRELLNSKESDDRIFLVKCGEGKVDGVFETVDGYIDLSLVQPDDIVRAVIERYRLVYGKSKNLL